MKFVTGKIATVKVESVEAKILKVTTGFFTTIKVNIVKLHHKSY
jgi:hypothetical protein